MGTGKGAAFSGSEANSPVDPFAATIVGKGTWGDKYLAPNKDYFYAAAAGIAGTGAVLWANLEGMAPATTSNSCTDSLPRTVNKSPAGPTTSTDGHCQERLSPSCGTLTSPAKEPALRCKNQIRGWGSQRPSSLTRLFDPATGQVEVLGFNLQGSTATVRWTDQGGQQLE